MDEKYYDAASGSTIITLKESFLKKLSAGKHTITVLYTDGETEADFKVLASTDAAAESDVPDTGDEANFVLWTTLMAVSACAYLFLTKKRYAGK